MHVLLLATDEQPKLPLLTDTIPAPLVPIVNRPVLAVAVEILARAGYKDLLVSLCHNGGNIASYFGNGSRWGVTIEYVIQREGWGSAGALAWAAQLLTETVLVLPGESIVDLDIEAALAFHRGHGGPATMILHQPIEGQGAQLVAVDERGRVCGLGGGVSETRLLAHVGAYIFEPSVLEHIPPRTHFDTYSQLIPALLAAGVEVHGYRMEGYWNSLESFPAYQEAQRVFLYSAYNSDTAGQADSGGVLPRVRYPSIEGHQIAPGIWVGPNHVIHPGARLAPPLCIGEGCRIGYGVELGPEVVIGSSVVIDDEATIYQSTILERTYVGQLVNVNNRMVHKTTLIDARTSESTQVVDPFLLAETRLSSSSDWLRRSMRVLVALVLLLVTLPLSVLAGLTVALFTGGRIFTRSPHVGRSAASRANQSAALQTIELLAFQTSRPDGTMSSVGRWLHKWELDRLPELWNVFRGDLELVGVKPLLPAEAALLNEEWHQKRFECRPGFTGLWYIQSGPKSDLDAILVADAYYAATHTWRDDLVLLWRTPAAWLRRLRSGHVREANDNDFSGQMDNVGSI
jgi:NDP-sugar pyrophosphorylase family protein